MASMAAGWFAGFLSSLCFAPAPWLRLIVQFASGGFTIAATLGYLVDVETWGKDTKAERLSKRLLWLFYVIGAFLLALSLSW